MARRFNNKKLDQYRHRDLAGMSVCYTMAYSMNKHKHENSKNEKFEKYGPNIKFKKYYNNYIQTQLNGNMPTMLQTIEIARCFLDEEENKILKKVYTIEDLINWLPKKDREEDENER